MKDGEKDDDMDGRSINPKMAMKRNTEDDEPMVEARTIMEIMEHNGDNHHDGDGHGH